MDLSTLIHQGVLFLHLIAFAIALSAVLREDLAMLFARRIDVPRLARTARTLTGALLALWLTGLTLLVFDAGLDPHLWLVSPKSAAKLLVVVALSANGVALHTWAFPALRGKGRSRRADDANVPVILGAISTASWLCASFIGVSRLIAPAMTFIDFMVLYAGLTMGAVVAALLFVRPRLARLLLTER